jgi:hypothetical protein
VTISLVSAPVLGFDLVRHPRGRSVADVLLWALNLGPVDLPDFRVEAGRDVSGRAHAWSSVRHAQDVNDRGCLSGSALAPAAVAAPAGTLAGIIEGLRGSLVVDLDDLEHLIRHDVLAWTEAAEAAGTSQLGGVAGDAALAAEVVLDAVTAEWVHGLDEASRTTLTGPYRRVRARVGQRPNDPGPCAEQVERVLVTLRTLGADGRARLRTVNTVSRPGGAAWAEAVHEASWAALTTGRIRAAATAQLLAAQAFTDGGLDAADGADGVWNLISGYVHALVVSDVLPATTLDGLAYGWQAALGY